VGNIKKRFCLLRFGSLCVAESSESRRAAKFTFIDNMKIHVKVANPITTLEELLPSAIGIFQLIQFFFLLSR
jgi:hypothetical protein